MSLRDRFSVLLLLPALVAATQAQAQAQLPADSGSAVADTPASAAPQVALFMARRNEAPIWYRNGNGPSAAATMVQILRRAPLDGLPSGPALADLVEQATSQASNGDPAAIARADRTLSAAWLSYVEALAAPLPDFTYSDRTLAPRKFNPSVTLQQAAIAPSLPEYLTAVSNVNPIYAEMRDVAWTRMDRDSQASPSSRLLINLARARVFPSTGKYLVVNAATQQLLMIENRKIVDQMKVIVGRPDSQTPMLASTIWYATLNPYWYVPMDLTKKLVAAKMLSPIAKSYWAEKRYEIMSDFGPNPSVLPPSAVNWRAVQSGEQTVYLRQLPGKGNSMGRLKFRFPNEIGVYLHDTDHPELFAQKQRTLSNGCIRLEDAIRLGRRMMGRDPLSALNGDAPEQHVQLPTGIPVYLTYLTAIARNGSLAFAADVYGRDGVNAPGALTTPDKVG